MKPIFLPLLAGVLVAHCSGAQFRTSDLPLPDPTPTKAADVVAKPPPTQMTEEFDVESVLGKIDMVWVIDNSGSMTEEAEQVRNNFTQFLDTLGDKVDAKVALISKASADSAMGSSTHVALTEAQLAAGHAQVDADVGSTNALAILASAICAASATDFATDGSSPSDRMKICGTTLTAEKINTGNGIGYAETLENPSLVKGVRGKLQSFFRAEAKRVFVVVTDDEASFVTDKNFLSLIRASAPSGTGDPTIFAFRGTDSSPVADCSITAQGKRYEALATATKGGVFDICEPDWSGNFERLRDGVGRIANTEFLIKDPAFKAVSAVLIDGLPLKAGEYTVTGRKVVIKAEVLHGSSKRISVRYTR